MPIIELCIGALIGSVIGTYQSATLKPGFDKIKDWTTLKCMEGKEKVQKYRESRREQSAASNDQK